MVVICYTSLGVDNYMLKLRELDAKKKRMIIIVSVLVLFIGVSFAYVVAQISGGAIGNANVTADTTDNLKFSVNKDISLNPTQFNVTEGGGGLSDSAVGTASLLANSTNNTFSTTYYVYFNINSNNYVYTTEDQKPEIVLTILDPNNNPITELPNKDLTYVTAENADGTTVSGFDITTANDLFNIASLYPISSTSSTEATIQNWTFTVTFINLTTNQTENGGKTLNAEVILSKEVYRNPDTVLTAYSNGSPFTHALGNYDITTDCSLGSAVWDNKAGGVVIDFSNANRAKCNVNYTEKDSVTYLNKYIIGLSGTTQGTGQVVNENGYRYEGKDPNNYIWFNNELWRIIGVFDEASHGQSGQNLVKIIKNDSIGGLAWHKSNTNDWTASSLMNLLNGAYLNSENGTGGEYCYGYSTSVPANCDYTESGINDTYRPMIESVTWYLGGHSTYSATADAFYGYERGDSVYSGRPTSTTGYIGLMYPSDYGYSVLASSCSRTTNLGDYDSAKCIGQSWLYGQVYEWTITPRSSISDYVFRLGYRGYLSASSASSGFSARPVLYLDSNVYIYDGSGTVSDPYIIGM